MNTLAQDEAKSGFRRLRVYASFLEIYNEKIYDLLVDPIIEPAQGGAGAAMASIRRDLKLQTDQEGASWVIGLKEVELNCADDAQAVVQQGKRNRAKAETQANRLSSRSHSVLTLTLARSSPNGKDKEELYSKLCVVDLAGSERSHRTQNTGNRLKESVKINTSLMVLARCLEVLRTNQLPHAVQQVSFFLVLSFFFAFLFCYFRGGHQYHLRTISHTNHANAELVDSMYPRVYCLALNNCMRVVVATESTLP